MTTQKSPLRYPGGKSRAVKIIMQYITTYFPNISEMCSPFMGGGSIEIACATKDITVYAYDIFDPLVCFWNYLLKDKQALFNEVQKFHPMSRDQFYHYQELNPTMPDSLERAAMFYALNRASFSGSTLSGGMSPEHPRFNDSNMQTLLNCDFPKLSVERMDCLEAIQKHKDTFLYLDPPYLLEQKQQNKLYGIQGSTHQDFNHQGLFDLLKDRNDWIMSYNNSIAIKEMYDGFKITEPKWAYGMSKTMGADGKSTMNTANEALIFSKNLTELDQLSFKLAA